MVRVPVDAAGLERHEHVGAHVADHAHQLPHDVVGVRVEQRGRMLVLRRPRHARVAVVEEPHVVDAERPGGGPQLALADLAERLGRRERRVGDLADFAARRAHDDDLVPLLGRASHDTAGTEGLIVGVGERDEERAPRHY